MRHTKNEIKDATIVALAHYFLVYDSDDELGLYINKKASKIIGELIIETKKALEPYDNPDDKKRINNAINSMLNRCEIKKGDFSTTAPQLGCELLYLGLAPNERKAKILAPNLARLYTDNKEKIHYILDKAYDTKYKSQAIDCSELARIYIERILI